MAYPGGRGRSLEESFVAAAMPRRPDRLPTGARRRTVRAAAALTALGVELQLGQAAYGPGRTAPAGAASQRTAQAPRARPISAKPRVTTAAPARRRVAATPRTRARSALKSRRRRKAAPRLSANAPAKLRAHPERVALLPAFVRASEATGVPAPLLEALAWQESGWQTQVVSHIGAVGIGQLLPITVSFTNGLLNQSLDPARPEDNVLLSARYMAYLLGRTGGNEAGAIAAYAQGLASLQREGMHPGTRQYVVDVLALRDRFAP